MSDLQKLFTELAELDSPSGNESEVSNYVVNYLKGLGLEPIQDDKMMIYCRVGNETPKGLFCSHLDTVEPGKGIHVISEAGYLQSAGETILGADNKVAVAAILHALTVALRSGEEINAEFIFSVREETNSGISEFNSDRLRSKVAYVFDVGNGDLGKVVVAAPFIVDFEISITGVAAHASKPELGKNVLTAMNLLLNEIKLGRPDEISTLNIGLISGGDATNSVPSHLNLAGDLRSTIKENFDQNKRILEEAAARAAIASDCQIEVNWIPYSFGYALDTTTTAYKKVESLYSHFGLDLKKVRTTSGSDAGFLNTLGIEAFCLGDGVENPHRTDERIKISTFEKLTEIILELIKL